MVRQTRIKAKMKLGKSERRIEGTSKKEHAECDFVYSG